MSAMFQSPPRVRQAPLLALFRAKRVTGCQVHCMTVVQYSTTLMDYDENCVNQGHICLSWAYRIARLAQSDRASDS